MKMTLEEFIAEETRRLAAFKKMWQAEMAKGETVDGEHLYPAEMNPGDWDDQYLSFDEAV